MKVGLGLLLLATAIGPVVSAQETTPSDDAHGGIVYGEGHAFFIRAPQGWVLDNSSGVDQGLYAVFYPKGQTWSNSDAVMYVNTAIREDDQVLGDFIDWELGRSRQASPDLSAARGRAIETEDGRTTEVRHLSGDRWGNYEAVAYLDEQAVFVMFVLSAKSKPLYDRSYDAFENLVGSYHFITEDVILGGDSPSK